MIGKFVNHKKYGKGQVTKVIGNNNYYVKFEKIRKEIVFPLDSFTEEYFIFSEDDNETDSDSK